MELKWKNKIGLRFVDGLDPKNQTHIILFYNMGKLCYYSRHNFGWDDHLTKFTAR